MAPQRLDLGLSLGLGLVSQHGFSFYPGGNVAAEQDVGAPAVVTAEEQEEEERTCSPRSPASSGSGGGSGNKRAERSAGSGDEDDDGSARKKLRLSKDQAAVLEECFKTHHTLTPKQKAALANSLGLRPRQVEVWFQNRRARTKLKQTEVDCEYMKRWCEQLAEQNRRLEKEVAELRALKAAPTSSPGGAAGPLTTLTMCMSCKRVASSSSSSSPACTAANLYSTGHAAVGAHIAAGMPSQAALPGHRQFFCGFRETTGPATAAYGGTSSGLAKAVKAAR